MSVSNIYRVLPILAGLFLAYAGPCDAQVVYQQPSAVGPRQVDPEDTAPGRSGSSQEPLGQKLNCTSGVLHPPLAIAEALIEINHGLIHEAMRC